jgi:hypothetical protein
MAIDYNALDCALKKDLKCTGASVVFGESINSMPQKPPYVRVTVLSVVEEGLPWEESCYEPCSDPLEEFKVFYRQCRIVTLRFEAISGCLGFGNGADSLAESAKLGLSLGRELSKSGWGYLTSTSVLSETFSRAGTKMSRSIFDVSFSTQAILESCPTTFIECIGGTKSLECAATGSLGSDFHVKYSPYSIELSGAVLNPTNPTPWSIDIQTEPDATVWFCVNGKRLKPIATDLTGFAVFVPGARYQKPGTYSVMAYVRNDDCVHASTDVYSVEVV